MIRRAFALFLLAALFCFAVASVDLPEKWRSWRYFREFAQPPAETDDHAELALPWEIFGHCAPGCADVRIIDLQGAEVPFEIVQKHSTTSTGSRSARVIENSFVAGQYTQIIADVGEAHEESFDRVKVETSQPNFILWAEVALSDDAKTWRVVEPRAPIARFRSRAVEGTQTIPFAGLSSRYIRVRIAEPSERFPVDGLSVLEEVSDPYNFGTPVPAAFSHENSADAGIDSWRATLASSNQPISQLRVNTSTLEFYRAVRVSTSGDGQEWSYVGSGVIYRYKQGEKTRESLSIEFPESTGGRLVRAEVVNGNDQPLADAAFALSAVPHTLFLKRTAGQQYRLIYGNEKAGRPQYDLAHYLDFGPAKPGYRILTLLPEEATANYRDPRPFTERHPEVLWTALGVAIVLIGLTAIRTLRTPDKPARQA